MLNTSNNLDLIEYNEQVVFSGFLLFPFFLSLGSILYAYITVDLKQIKGYEHQASSVL